jgi:hypothetical protein
MPKEATFVRRAATSLPDSWGKLADRGSAPLQPSRSAIIARVVVKRKAAYEANLAAEGYRFYAQEASEFAGASAVAVAEAWSD